ncbi:hypothetical protein HN873_072552 [Arachis hypogaea]
MQASQKGSIGITLVSHWFMPFSNSPLDITAAERSLDFMYGWFMEPLTTGDYPESMKSIVGSRLPKFSKEQSKQLIHSYDFIGLNYYTTNYASNAPKLLSAKPNYATDSHVNFASKDTFLYLSINLNIYMLDFANGAASTWLYVYPKGIRELLLHTKKKYNNPLIYITENGIDEYNDPTLSLEEALLDTFRVDFYYRHLFYLQHAIKDGANVKGYFAWSLLDNFEWSAGYTVRFGLNYVDYKNGHKRYNKLSAKWFKSFLKRYY